MHGVSATILAKLEYFNPAASVKDRIGAAMVIAMEKAGVINADTVLIEPTSGNTGIGLSLLGNALGYRTTIVIPDTQSPEKIEMLMLCGAELELVTADNRDLMLIEVKGKGSVEAWLLRL